ncbi:MAG: hypothetical protein HOP08_09995 [Cyclobacteriaceae bacterium]|nr:hypothetical protein [Cyclobacteriaceae bacterium]
MSNRTQANSTSPILVAVILIITFPLWFGLLAGLFGIVIGLMGAAIGLFAGLFGIVAGVIAIPFKILFGWGDWGWHGFPHFHSSGLWMIIFIIIAAVIVKRKRAS